MFLYTQFIYQPLLNLLVYLYNVIPGHDLGIVIILLTLLVRLILYPINRRMIISQKAMQSLQPKIEALKEQYKDDREKLGKAMMALYKEEKISPFSSCLPVIIQLPILFGVFQVFRNGLSSTGFGLLYPFVADPGTINVIAFGFLDLAKKSIPLAILAGLAQFWQTKMLMSKKAPTKGATDMQSAMNKQMLYIMPAMTVVIGSSFPAGLSLYWFFTTVFSALQQLLMMRKKEISSN